MYSLKCADMGHADCPFVAQDETQEGVIEKLMAHAKETHPDTKAKLESMTPEQLDGAKNMMISKMTQE